MKRILIIGSSGAGKTTLAQALSQRLGIPHTELDSIYHRENWQPLDSHKFKQRVYEIAEGEKWVLCGNYFSKLGIDLWHRADTIIWCDYSFPLVFNRLLKRTVTRAVTKEELWNGNREELYANFFTNDSILWWMMKSWNKQKRRYGKLFSEPELFPTTRLVRLKKPQAAVEFLQSIEQASPAAVRSN